MPLKKHHVDKLNWILQYVNWNIVLQLSKPIVNGQLNSYDTHQPTYLVDSQRAQFWLLF